MEQYLPNIDATYFHLSANNCNFDNLSTGKIPRKNLQKPKNS